MSPVGLLIDEVTIETGPCTVNVENIGENLVQADFVARISQESIATFLNELSPAGLSDISVTVLNGLIQIDAKKQVVFAIPAKATAKLEIRDNALLIILVEASAAGAGLTQIVKNQLDEINPILGSNDLPFPTTFASVEHEGGFVVLKGKMSLGLPNL